MVWDSIIVRLRVVVLCYVQLCLGKRSYDMVMSSRDLSFHVSSATCHIACQTHTVRTCCDQTHHLPNRTKCDRHGSPRLASPYLPYVRPISSPPPHRRNILEISKINDASVSHNPTQLCRSCRTFDSLFFLHHHYHTIYQHGTHFLVTLRR